MEPDNGPTPWPGATGRRPCIECALWGYRCGAVFARLLVSGVLLLACAAPAAAAQTSSVPSSFPSLDNSATARAIVTDDRTAYVGGIFGSVGAPAGPFAVVSGVDGSFVRNAPGLVRWGYPDSNDGEDLTAEAQAVVADGSHRE